MPSKPGVTSSDQESCRNRRRAIAAVPATAPPAANTRPMSPAPEPPPAASEPPGTAVGTGAGVLVDSVGVGVALGVCVGVCDGVGLAVVGLGVGVTHCSTQKTLCLVSAPCEPSALIVSLTWKP